MEEEVTLKFGQKGEAEATRAVQRVRTEVDSLVKSFQQLGGRTSPSTSFVQMMSKDMPEAGKKLTSTFESIGTGSINMNSRVGAMSRVFTNLFAQVAGQVNPALGQMVGSVQAGAQAMRFFGPSVALAVTAADLFTSAVTSVFNRIVQAEEAQIKLNIAVKNMDMSAAIGQLRAAQEELERFNFRQKQINEGGIGGFVAWVRSKFEPSLDEVESRLAISGQAVQDFYAKIEQPKIQFERRQSELQLNQQSAAADVARAMTSDEATAALRRQQQAILDLAEARAKEVEREASLEAARRQATGGVSGGMQAEDIKRTAAARAKGIRGAGALESQALGLGTQEREASQAMSQGLFMLQNMLQRRASLMENARTRELAELESSNKDAISMMEERSRIEERYVTKSLDDRVTAIDAERSQLQAFAAAYPNVRSVQEQVDKRLIELQRERVQAEADADNKIVQQRQQMLQELKNLADQEAGIGDQLTSKAMENLRKRGRTKISASDVAEETGRIREQAEDVMSQFRAGGTVDMAKLQEAQGLRGLFQQMQRAGTTPSGAVGQSAEATLAALQGRPAPTAPGQQGFFDPTSGQSLRDYQARLELQRAREQLSTLGPTAGKLPPQEATKLDESMKKVEDLGSAAITRMTERIPPLMQDWFEKFVDALVRKLEFEAART